jgi:hypothetical protein
MENLTSNREVIIGNYQYQTRQTKSSTKVDECSSKGLLQNLREA